MRNPTRPAPVHSRTEDLRSARETPIGPSRGSYSSRCGPSSFQPVRARDCPSRSCCRCLYPAGYLRAGRRTKPRTRVRRTARPRPPASPATAGAHASTAVHWRSPRRGTASPSTSRGYAAKRSTRRCALWPWRMHATLNAMRSADVGGTHSTVAPRRRYPRPGRVPVRTNDASWCPAAPVSANLSARTATAGDGVAWLASSLATTAGAGREAVLVSSGTVMGARTQGQTDPTDPRSDSAGHAGTGAPDSGSPRQRPCG